MRWADLDLLGHVNNVVYVDYLQEARVDLLRHHGPSARAEGGLVEGVVVVRHEVEYVAPLESRQFLRSPRSGRLEGFRPVSIEVWVTEIRAATFTLAYEVFHDTDAGRRVYLRAGTLLAPYVFGTERPRRLTDAERQALEKYLDTGGAVRPARRGVGPREAVGHYPVHVRFSDVDAYGHVNNVTYFEYLMEARILLMARLGTGLPEETPQPLMVVARTDVDYRLPILFRERPYDAWSWISRVGDTSVTIESEICDGDALLARARVVSVFVDAATQRPTRPSEAYRQRLEKATRTC